MSGNARLLKWLKLLTLTTYASSMKLLTLTLLTLTTWGLHQGRQWTHLYS